MDTFIDVPMHSIFLGCVKTINGKILRWCTYTKKESEIVRCLAPSLVHLYDLKLEWCNILPLSASYKFSGLVSENWIAVARLHRWMQSPIQK